MSCSYWGTDYNAARYQADICNYNTTVAKINEISQAYEVKINDASALLNLAAKYNMRAKAVATVGVWQASIGLEGKAKKTVREAMDMIEEAKATLNLTEYRVSFAYPTPIIVGYDAYNNPIFQTYYQIGGTSEGEGEQRTYEQAIAYVNNLADVLANYSSWSFSIGIGFGGDSTTFTIGADTVSTLVNMSLELANDIGLISDKTLRDIKSNPLWQVAISAVSSYGMSYSMSTFGFTSTPLGYTKTSLAKSMMSSEVRGLFNTIESLGMIYNAYKMYDSLSERQDQKEAISSEPIKITELKDTDIYATGEYYKTFAGQQFFNVGLAGHEGYVPGSAQIPSWGIVGERPHSEDQFMADIMNQNRNALKAGGGGFLNHITEGAIPLS